MVLGAIGGTLYWCIEILWRGWSHPVMAVVGGACFILCGLINEYFPWEMPIVEQMSICSVLITGVEFLAGTVLNLWLGFGIWDYTNLPFNLYGQICLPYSVAWFMLSGIAIVLDDYLRYWIFGEDSPHYKLVGHWILLKRD